MRTLELVFALGSASIILGSVSYFVVNKIEENAVMKNELQEASQNETKFEKELEIANRPNDDADALLQRMRDAK